MDKNIKEALITREEVQEYIKNDLTVELIGKSNFKEAKEDEKFFEYEEKKYRLTDLSKDEGLEDFKKFLKISETEFVAYKHNPPIIILLLPLLLLLLLIILPNPQKDIPTVDTPTPDIEITPGVPFDGPENGDDTPIEMEMIAIPGYYDVYVTEDKPTITLGNPEENTVYFVYEVVDMDGNELAKTDAIKPGEGVPVEFYSLLEKGSTEVVFKISTYDIETMETCNGGNVTVIINKK